MCNPLRWEGVDGSYLSSYHLANRQLVDTIRPFKLAQSHLFTSGKVSLTTGAHESLIEMLGC